MSNSEQGEKNNLQQGNHARLAAQLFDRATLDLSKKSVQPLIYLYISFFFESLTHSAGVTNRGNDSSTYTSFCLAGVFYTHWAARSTGNRSFADRVAFTVILIARISSRSTGDSASSAAWALTQPQKTKISSIQGHLSKPRLHSSCVAS
ncbi:MAG TPA: hypothetical protein VEO92_02070 [Candidatus Nitrosocosmicus sp.]|nr:hypothetical protein [Candidatus Nitrosocosmicus sp.]